MTYNVFGGTLNPTLLLLGFIQFTYFFAICSVQAFIGLDFITIFI